MLRCRVSIRVYGGCYHDAFLVHYHNRLNRSSAWLPHEKGVFSALSDKLKCTLRVQRLGSYF